MRFRELHNTNSQDLDVRYSGYKDIWILNTFWKRNLKTPHSQDHGFLGFKDTWDLAMIRRFSENITPPGWRILRIWGFMKSFLKFEIMWVHHAPRMLDIEDLRIYQFWVHFEKINWKPYTARMLDFEDLRIFEIWLKFGYFLKTPHPGWRILRI